MHSHIQYLFDHLGDVFFVAVHFGVCPNLSEIDVLSVAECDDFIESKNELKCVLADLGFAHHAAVLGNDLGEEAEGFQVLENVAILRRNQHHVK